MRQRRACSPLQQLDKVAFATLSTRSKKKASTVDAFFFEQAYKPGSVYAAIYLGRLLPDASSHLPKTDRASPAPWGAVFLPVLLWIEFTGSPSYLGDRWALTPPFHPYHAKHGGISLLHLS